MCDLSSPLVLKSSAQGTVPYLGIFLTDLTMLDTAVKDKLEVSVFPSLGVASRPLRSLLLKSLELGQKSRNGWLVFDKGTKDRRKLD